MEAVTGSANLNRAYKRVKGNGGSAGVDGMTVGDLLGWIAGNREALIARLLDGRYKPQPVRGVWIPKPGGGERQLGIPTVVDRLVQQAIAQVLEPLLDPTFSGSSFGFRPGRGAHDALRQARDYVADGYEIVVDMDLEKFFDRVNHDIPMSRLARRVGDKRLLRIVRRFLQAGLMADGVCRERYEGTPQGGPLSPLLANLLLDDLDKELERRGAPVLPLCGRLQHLRAVASSGGTGDGVGDDVPGRQAQAQGQPAEERCRPGRGTSVPRPPARQRGTARDRA